ncbi:MAG: dimethylarginine dimethylaminohydrolase family protein [Acidimicrobiales bacterium]
MSALPWGRRYLMCRPDYFTVVYEINPWMHSEVRPDVERAVSQFDGLVLALGSAGAEIELMPPVDGLPDLVFTANAGIVSGDRFVPAHFRHKERQGETAVDTAWFESRGYAVDLLPDDITNEGAGDALPFFGESQPPVLVAGYRLRSDAASHAHLSRLTAAPVRSLELVDERFYHLDLVFCPLDDRHAIVAPIGLDSYGMRVMEALVPEPLYLEDDEAVMFCANSVVVGSNIVMPACPPRVGRVLEGWGFAVEVAPVGEFQKAGGGCRCLTLALDVDLSVPGQPAPR